MRRLIIALIVLSGLAATGCSSGGDGDVPEGDAAPADASTTTVTAAPAETTPPTTETIPPEATEIPDLQIIVVEFGASGFVEVANMGDEVATVDGIQLCQSSTCVGLGSVASGPLAAGASLQVPAVAVGGLDEAGGEAALFAESAFDDPAAILGYVQWGTGGARVGVAVEAGIWADGATVTPDPAYNSIELFGDPADVEAWS